MGFLRNATAWMSRLFSRWQKSIGEKVWAHLMSGYGAYGLPGSWSSDRKELANHLKGWAYVSIKIIAEEIAALVPQVGRVITPEEYEEKIGKALKRCAPDRRKHMERAIERRMVRGSARKKSLASLAPHEELELVDGNHRLMQLLRNPNGWDTGNTFWYRTSMSLDMFGNFYWWVLSDGFGMPCEAWVLPPQWVWPSPIRNPDDIITWYEIRPYGAPGGAGSFKIPADEIIHGQYPHPLTMWDGFSPLTAMAPWIDVLESMDACQFSSFKNQFGLDAYIKLDKGLDDPDPAGINRLLSRLEERHLGEANHRRPTVLSPGAEIVYPKGVAPYEMDYVAGGDAKKDWVLSGWGVSKFMAGLSEDVNKASSRVAFANFFRKVIRSRLLLIDGVTTQKLAKKIDPNLVVYHDDPTADDPEERRLDIALRLQARSITPNEVRTAFGDEPFPNGGDDPVGAPTDIPLPWVSGEQIDVDALAAVMQQLQEAKSKPAGAGPQPFGTPGAIPGDSVPTSSPPPESALPKMRNARIGPVSRLPSASEKAMRNGHTKNGKH